MKGGRVRDFNAIKFGIEDLPNEERKITVENLGICEEGEEEDDEKVLKVEDINSKVCTFFGSMINARGPEGTQTFLRRIGKIRLNGGPTLNTEDILIKREEG